VEQIKADISQGSLKGKSEYRDRIDLLRSRVNLLVGKDKILMKMYLENGNSFRQMARLAGVNEASIGRRIHRTIRRLINGEYITCLRNRDKFTKTEINIARDYFVSGLPIKKIAARRRSNYYQVRQILLKIQRFVTVAEEAEEGQGGKETKN